MTDEILPLGYPPKTRRVCQPYIDQIAVLSARLADAEAALATARADALRLLDGLHETQYRWYEMGLIKIEGDKP